MLRKVLPFLEAVILYGLTLTVLWPYIPEKVFFYMLTFYGVLFSFFYGILGVVISILGLLIGMSRYYYPELILTSLKTEDFLIIVFNAGLFLLIGSIKQNLLQNISALNQSYHLAKERIASLTSQLVSIDISYRRFLEEFFLRLDEPLYLYQELRKVAAITVDEKELFARLFFILNRYCFVEGGCVYTRANKEYHRLFKYGLSKMPEILSEKDYHEWLEVLKEDKEIILPTSIERYGFVMAIPIVSRLVEKINFLILIERIRYVALNEDTLRQLKVAGFMVKLILERRLYAKEMAAYSLVPHIIVFKPQVAPKILKERLNFLKRMRISYKLAYFRLEQGKDIIEIATKLDELEATLREFDEKFVIGNRLILLLPFTEDLLPVKRRLKEKIGLEIEELSDEHLQELMVVER